MARRIKPPEGDCFIAAADDGLAAAMFAAKGSL